MRYAHPLGYLRYVPSGGEEEAKELELSLLQIAELALPETPSYNGATP